MYFASLRSLQLHVAAQLLEVSIALSHHDSLLQRSPGRELGVEDGVHLLQRAATGLDTQGEPDDAVDAVEADEDEVVPPVDGLERDGGDVRVVQVGAVGQNDVLS